MHIVTAKEMYEADRYAMETIGIEGKLLMENAGRAIADKAAERMSKTMRILVMCGSGSNGGDGFVIARTLLNWGYTVRVFQLAPDGKITGDAAYHKQLYQNIDGKIERWESAANLVVALQESDVVIDAMLGIGVTGKLRPPYDQAVETVNEAGLPVISVDIPSGVPADEGHDGFDGITADHTVIVAEPKQSLFAQQTASYYGSWEVVDIGLPSRACADSGRYVWGMEETRAHLGERGRFSHKGSHGKALLIGGSQEMPGSITLTTKAALRGGSGLVTTGTVPQVIPSIAAHCAEATYLSLNADGRGRIVLQDVDVSGYDALAVGMGMGREQATADFTRKLVSEAKIPVLVDADGLHHLKQDMRILTQRRHPSILTPHPGEMAMLTGFGVKDIIQRPFATSRQFAIEYGVYLVLKGSFTIVTDPEGNQWVNTSGNAGLAKGGSGDALSGILLAQVMQQQNIQQALSTGCYIHGMSADQQVTGNHSMHDLTASDVIDGLASVFRTLS
ncbi:NAD(P)H-hydrate dehydratase [Sediminibacillus dalangtanensis]|uniref:Bifunctional NAD(P)H-hydrate repair enzyme n=1 Tax=Sediminibacillus dalangtanensis TaxID=2729421 RepID=A0ABX7VNW2_9BACI|nr:NAD(P)H-hydrate dehydratase [Sediminibacillus dalangtanensis]QTM98123.1 NAD(P)H-hydrate dehydratase [Sediminibacillus dalangtanensis]